MKENMEMEALTGTQSQQEKPEPTSGQAKERAAIVLEVLAGTLAPMEAAEKLSINPPAYYSLESRALQGLVKACESRPKGPGHNYKRQIRELQEANRKLEREARRYQSLTRAAQKAIGLMQEHQEPASPARSPKTTIAQPKKRTPKKVRAQRAADRLRGKTRKRTTTKTIQSLQKAEVE